MAGSTVVDRDGNAVVVNSVRTVVVVVLSVGFRIVDVVVGVTTVPSLPQTVEKGFSVVDFTVVLCFIVVVVKAVRAVIAAGTALVIFLRMARIAVPLKVTDNTSLILLFRETGI